jgi:hypothetical protein
MRTPASIADHPILLGSAGMFLGAYDQGRWRTLREDADRSVVSGD